MTILTASGLSLAYGERDVLKSISLILTRKTKTALAGANGSGKSTLMKVLTGEIKADSGTISVIKNGRIAYLPQSGIVHQGKTLMEEAETAFSYFHGLLQKQDEIGHQLSKATEHSKQTEMLLQEFDSIHETLEYSGYHRRQEQIERVLTGLGFSKEDLHRDAGEFSGGWQMRIALAKILLRSPDVLLLDEPTNYLDIEARVWLKTFLQSFPGGYLIVSHDRYFLDETTTEVLEIFNGKLIVYKGNYTAYEKQSKQNLESLIAAWEQQQQEIEKLESFISRFRYNASKAALVQSRVKQLEKMELIEIPEHVKTIHFNFPPPPHSGRKVLETDGLSRNYESVAALKSASILIEKGEKVVVSGMNGAGKSTMLRIIAGRDSDYTGSFTLGSGVKIGYFAQDQSEELNPENTIIEEIENSAPTELVPKLRNLLGAFLFRGDDIYKKVSVLSGGEKSRVSLMKLLLEPSNFLILDEPTNHLDLHSKDILLESLKSFPGTILFVSHDPYFNSHLATKVLELNHGEARIFQGDYDYYLWKIEDEQKVSDNAAGPAGTSQDNSTTIITSSSNVTRQQRKQTKSDLRRLEREEHEILEQLENIDKKIEEIHQMMTDPAVYENGSKVKELKDQLEAFENQHETLTAEWEKNEAKLAELHLILSE